MSVAPFAAPGPFDDVDDTPAAGPPMTPKAAAAVLVDLGYPQTVDRPRLAQRVISDHVVREHLWRLVIDRHHPHRGGSPQTWQLANDARDVLAGSWG